MLAGIDLLTGEAVSLVSETHKNIDFVIFLGMLDAKYPKEDKICISLDNYSAHTSKETQEYLNLIPNHFEFVFTFTRLNDKFHVIKSDTVLVVIKTVFAE